MLLSLCSSATKVSFSVDITRDKFALWLFCEETWELYTTNANRGRRGYTVSPFVIVGGRNNTGYEIAIVSIKNRIEKRRALEEFNTSRRRKYNNLRTCNANKIRNT